MRWIDDIVERERHACIQGLAPLVGCRNQLVVPRRTFGRVIDRRQFIAESKLHLPFQAHASVLGRGLDELEALGLAERTVVTLFGDHGWHLGEQGQWAKTTNFELDARAPLMLHVPGMRTGGRSTGGIVEFVDMVPTPCEACGIERPDGLEGESIMAMVDDPNDPGKDAAFNQLPRPYLADKNWEQMGYSIRTDRHRYTEWINRKGSVVGRELYDLANSRFGTVNLADRSTHQPLIENLSARLRDPARFRASKLAP